MYTETGTGQCELWDMGYRNEHLLGFGLWYMGMTAVKQQDALYKICIEDRIE
jgi:hypothetical protein